MTNGNITPCTFVVCEYSDATGNVLVALLKLDFTDFYRLVEKTEDTIKIISLEQINDALPPEKVKLHKSVFVKKHHVSNTYGILLLDRQLGREETDVAHFFRDGFLNCSILQDDRRNTKQVYDLIEGFISEKYTSLQTKIKKLALVSKIFNQTVRFNIDDFSNVIFDQDIDVVAEFRELIIVKNGLNGEFEIDNDIVNSHKRLSFNLVEGIELNVANRLLVEDDNTITATCVNEDTKTYDIIISGVHFKEGSQIITKR